MLKEAAYSLKHGPSIGRMQSQLNLFNPLWLRTNKIACICNRLTEKDVRNAEFRVESVHPFRLYAETSPAPWPSKLIRASKPATTMRQHREDATRCGQTPRGEKPLPPRASLVAVGRLELPTYGL